MSKIFAFVAGALCGSVIVGAAATERGWLRAANEVIHDHSGARFYTSTDPSPFVGIDTRPIAATQVVTVSASPPPDPESPPPDPESPPPDPEFRAVLSPPPDPERPAGLVLQILHPESLTLVGPDGAAATLCSGIVVRPPG